MKLLYSHSVLSLLWLQWMNCYCIVHAFSETMSQLLTHNHIQGELASQ